MTGAYAKYFVLAVFLASFGIYKQFFIGNPVVDKLFVLGGLAILAEAMVALMGSAISKRIKDKRQSYKLKKVVSYATYIVISILALLVLLENPQAFAVAFGLIATALVVVFQDVLLSLVGFAYISIASPFTVGDRIELEGKIGDVVDTGPLFMTLLEIRNWVNADQTTGRIVMVPNNIIFKKQINNYTKHFDFIWDELSIPVTYESDWRKARDILTEIGKKNQLGIEELAKGEMEALEKKYYFERRDVVPLVYVTLTDNWIRLDLRYIVTAKERRTVQNRITNEVLERFEKEKNIKIASQTIKLLK